jgi:hypothetical protein
VCGNVVDTTGPSIDAFSVTPDTLWAPNHKLMDVVVGFTATDRSGVSCSLDVVSNDPAVGAGDGNTAEDWIVIHEHHVQLRAKRSGPGSGRAYTITATCADGWRNRRALGAVVRVPADAR